MRSFRSHRSQAVEWFVPRQVSRGSIPYRWRAFHLTVERRRFMAIVAGGLVGAPLAAEGKNSVEMVVVGVFGIGPTPSPQELAKTISANPFWLAMRQLGWVEGKT